MTTDYRTTKQIAGKFYYGKLGDFKVIINTENNTLNITKLCKYGGKQFFNWKKLDSAQSLIEYYIQNVAPSDQKGRHDCCIEVKSFDGLDINKETADLLRGTYVPDLIAIQVAQWISPEYAIKVSLIVREKEISDNRLLKAMNCELSRENLSLMEKLEVQNKKLDHVIKQNDKLLTKSNEILRRSNEIYELVKNDKPPNSECIIIYAHPDNDGKYYIRAGLKASIERRAKKDNGTNVICYENISNAKRALKEAKNIGIIPRNTTTCYNLSEKTYNNINKVLQGVDDKYKKDNEE